MKKILGLAVALVAVIAMLGTGTWAYFNDTVTVAGNTITAGSLSLTAGGPLATTPFTVGGGGGIRPGDKADAGTLTLTAGGTLNGDLYVKAANIKNKENGINSVETKLLDTTADDLVGPPIVYGGELGDFAYLAIWVNMGGTATFDNAADYYITASGTKVPYASSPGHVHTVYGGTVDDGAFVKANTLLVALDGATALATNISPASLGTWHVEYSFPDDTTTGFFAINNDNKTQSDSLEFDLDFALVQTGEPIP